jgi:hypothetical protein
VEGPFGTKITPEEHNLLEFFRADRRKGAETFHRLLDPLAIPGATVPGVAGGNVRPEGLLFFRKPQLLEQSLLEGLVPHREPGLDVFDADVDYPGPPAGRKAAGAPGPDFSCGKTLADALKEGLYTRKPGLRGIPEKA